MLQTACHSSRFAKQKAPAKVKHSPFGRFARNKKTASHHRTMTALFDHDFFLVLEEDALLLDFDFSANSTARDTSLFTLEIVTVELVP